LDASVSQPWLFGTRTLTTLGGYAEQIVQTQTGIRKFLITPLRAYGASIAFRRDLSLITHGTLSVEHRHVISDSTSLPLAPGVEQKSYSTRRVGVSLERDTRLDPFDPKAGSDLIGNTVVAGGVLKGSARFLKFSEGATTYIPVHALRRRVTLAFRIQSGYVNPFGHYGARQDTLHELDLIPFEDRFVTGGASSVRGYFENEIGNRFAGFDTTGAEIRENRGRRSPPSRLGRGTIPAILGPRWGGFHGRGERLGASARYHAAADLHRGRIGSGYSDMRYTVGAGFRIGTPVGPLRFDYGWKLRHAKPEEHDLSSTRGTFHFSLGQAF